MTSNFIFIKSLCVLTKMSETKKIPVCLLTLGPHMLFLFFFDTSVLCCVCSRAEGSSKIQSRLEQQTSRLSQQMKSSNSSDRTKSSTSSKSSPPKEKTSPASPMDDIERGDALSVLIHIAFISVWLRANAAEIPSLIVTDHVSLFFMCACVQS